ncbi:MAG TPA: hypothetical protein VNQ78_07020 [Paracoccus sp. (in: a-proteobacteria)]|uniref:hypothetical protein n=1 Tax=Paracoccus sp. TaxID=267 RepID=UPI002BDFB582|nr:hypothetical protein [Paracoccus sp. (in: a-proteobacteria)]HWL56417.1 hypothetical protein [Paracoccus sp. (in: a-proteobacteria)]
MSIHSGMDEDGRLVQFKLMLPADLKSRVEAAAKKAHRSLSQEIVATLEEEYPPDGFSLDEFFSTWMERTDYGDDPEEMRRFVEEADAVLMANMPRYSVYLVPRGPSGILTVTFGERRHRPSD